MTEREKKGDRRSPLKALLPQNLFRRTPAKSCLRMLAEGHEAVVIGTIF